MGMFVFSPSHMMRGGVDPEYVIKKQPIREFPPSRLCDWPRHNLTAYIKPISLA